MKKLIEFTGDAPELAKAELHAVLESGSICFKELGSDSLVSIYELERFEPASFERLALTRAVLEHHLSCEPNMDALRECALGIPVTDGTLSVRSRRLEGLSKGLRRNEVNEAVGAVLHRKGQRIAMEAPDREVVPLIANKVHIGTQLHLLDHAGYEARKVQNRPFFSPVSLHPKLCRALVNLTGLAPGQRLLDPFCGTGGILIECHLLGGVPVGGDISGRMVEGCRENLRHFGCEGPELTSCDFTEALDANRGIGAIATDPPYGRASSSAGEAIEELFARFFAKASEALCKGGRLAVVLPSQELAEAVPGSLSIRFRCVHRVHGSLDRHFYLFVKER